MSITADIDLVIARDSRPMVTIAELIELIERIGPARSPLPQGESTAVGYRDTLAGAEPLDLIHGDPTTAQHVPVHGHTECLPGDVFSPLLCHCGTRLQHALGRITDSQTGVVIYLREHRHSLRCAPTRHQSKRHRHSIPGRPRNQPPHPRANPRPPRRATGAEILVEHALFTALPAPDNTQGLAAGLFHAGVTLGRRRLGAQCGKYLDSKCRTKVAPLHALRGRGATEFRRPPLPRVDGSHP